MADLLGGIEFADFWKVWPRRVSRPTAEKSWQKLTPGEQKAVIADVEKRTRMRFWPANKKRIPHAATYLNQRRWEDEWVDEVGTDTDKPNSGAYVPRPPAAEPALPWFESMLNRTFRDWMFVHFGRHGCGVPDAAAAALKEKRAVLDQVVPAFMEELDSGAMQRGEVAREIADAFLNRLDIAYQRNLRAAVWDHARNRNYQQGRAS